MSEAKTIIYMSDGAEYGSTLPVQDVGEALTHALSTGQPLVMVTLAEDDGRVTINALQVVALREALEVYAIEDAAEEAEENAAIAAIVRERLAADDPEKRLTIEELAERLGRGHLLDVPPVAEDPFMGPLSTGEQCRCREPRPNQHDQRYCARCGGWI